jgi:hypothetical protein
VNSPLPLAEFLDTIKKMYEGSENPIVYKIVKIPARYDGSESVVCGTEITWNYDDLCIKMFDLNVSGWEISSEISGEAQTSIMGSIYNVVTIRMVRTI